MKVDSLVELKVGEIIEIVRLIQALTTLLPVDGGPSLEDIVAFADAAKRRSNQKKIAYEAVQHNPFFRRQLQTY
eukprot:6367518-Alexandrium_andersonii.AAC.1